MDKKTIYSILDSDSPAISDIKNNLSLITGFLKLVKDIDGLTNINQRFFEDSRSLYESVSKERSIQSLEAKLEEFFDAPLKESGKPASLKLRYSPTVAFLGGIREQQTLFVKKTKFGEFYGSLWPWEKTAGYITIHLGYCTKKMSKKDLYLLSNLVRKVLAERVVAEVKAGIGGQLQGISLPSFLQMAEVENKTCTLKVKKDQQIGYLYLFNGALIDANTANKQHREAAYDIISWNNPVIEIKNTVRRKEDFIQQSLMKIMMDSQRKKDERTIELDPDIEQQLEVEPSQPDPVPAKGRKKSSLPKIAAPTAKAESIKDEDKPLPKPTPKGKVPLIKITKPIDLETEKVTEKSQDPEKTNESETEEPTAAVADTPQERPRTKRHEDFLKMQQLKQAESDVQTQKRQRLLKLVALVLVSIVLMVGGIVVGVNIYSSAQISKDYKQVMAQVGKEKKLNQKIFILQQFIDRHSDHEYSQEARDRIKDIQSRIEDRDFNKLLTKIEALPVDQNYEKQAIELYQSYLQKHPSGAYATEIKKKIKQIPKVIDDTDFAAISLISKRDIRKRLSAYQTYLYKHPQGKHRKSVNKLLNDLSEIYFLSMEKEADNCKKQQRWDRCLQLADIFLDNFPNSNRVTKVSTMRAEMQGYKDLSELIVRAENAGTDYAAVKKMYSDYLIQHPDSPVIDAIRSELKSVDQKLAAEKEWQKVYAYALNQEFDIFNRVDRLERYLDKNFRSAHASEASRLLKKLRAESKIAARNRKSAAEKRKRSLALKKQRELQAREAERLRREKANMIASLKKTGDRFKVRQDGTVIDVVTGLTWCLLDSYTEKGRCLNFASAEEYVNELRTGNHTDWRLPTAGELVSLYKTPPYFPPSGAKWYWSSEVYSQAWQRKANVITSTPETNWKKIAVDLEKCGNVRAVRR